MPERVVVSGGSGGIGSALCRILRCEGFVPVIGFATGRARAESLAREVGGEVLPLDLTSCEQVDAAVTRLADGPPIAGLVLAAAPPPRPVRFGRVSADEMDLNWRVQVLGPHRLVAAAVKAWFRPQKRGAVVGVLSAAMSEAEGGAMPSMGAYLIGKYGLKGVLDAADADYPFLKVGSIAPGFTETPMLREFDDRFIAKLRARGLVAQPERVARELADVLLRALEPAELEA